MQRCPAGFVHIGIAFNQLLDKWQITFEGCQHEHAFILVISSFYFGLWVGYEQLGHIRSWQTHREHQGWHPFGVDGIGVKSTLEQSLNYADIVMLKPIEEVFVRTRYGKIGINKINNKYN